MNDAVPRLQDRPGVLLFLDYDGTLVPIRKTPELAVLSPRRRRLLKQLSRHVCVCIVSGRSLGDVRRLVGLRDIAYIGNHGLEMVDRDFRWIHPEAARSGPVLRDVLAVIRRRTRPWNGILVEDKGLTASVHYRRLSAPLPRKLRAIVEQEARAAGRTLKLTEGKKVFEIRPSVPWDKGKGVREFIRRRDPRPPFLPIYIGDDRTDEDAFRVLAPDGITICVGGKRDSLARHRLPNVAAVWEFLGSLLRMTAPSPVRNAPRGHSAKGARVRR